MPISSPRSDGVRAVCWESRGFAERMPSTFADRAERAYARSRDQRNELRRRVDGGDLRAIGRLDTLTGDVDIESEQNAATLAEWLGADELDRTELATTRGVIVQMYRDLVRDHGALRPEEETQLMLRAAGGGGRRNWHSA